MRHRDDRAQTQSALRVLVAVAVAEAEAETAVSGISLQFVLDNGFAKTRR